MHNLKLSIITINLNNLNGLIKTIESVVSLKSDEFEFIVIDGCSKDGSVEYIQTKENYINYWESTPDTGIYQAMNKGILKARGEYLFFLNSGDILIDNLITFLIYFNNYDIIAGSIKFNSLDNRINFPPENFNIYELKKKIVPHQGAFIKRNLFTKYGLYDEKYSIAGDWESWFRFCINGASYISSKSIVSIMEVGGIGNELSHRHDYEREQILSKYYRNLPIETWHYFLIKENKYLFRALKYYYTFQKKLQKFLNIFP